MVFLADSFFFSYPMAQRWSGAVVTVVVISIILHRILCSFFFHLSPSPFLPLHFALALYPFSKVMTRL